MNNEFQITDGHLYIGGCDTVKLAEQYGTPLYVMDETYIRRIMKAYIDAVKNSGLGGKVLYASKACLTLALCKIAQQEGLGLDVVSSGELYTAVKADFPRDRIYMHGNNKSAGDIEFAVKEGIGNIVIDNFYEIDLIDSLAKKYGKTMNVSLRIKPGIEAHTHEYIKTGTIDSKFGLGIEDGEALKAIKQILEKDNLNFLGFHCHIGSQIFELEPFRMAVDVLIDFALAVKRDTGYLIKEINFGGGFGITYTHEDAPLEPHEYLKALIEKLKERCEKENIPVFDFAIEPGRSIVGESGITLYTIGSIKDIKGVRKYISVDGGMGDNPRYALYQAKYNAVIAGRADEKPQETVTVAGRCCESGDMLIYDIELPRVNSGDILAVFSTGAYNFSMASNYNRLPVPAIVLACDGKSELMVKPQSFEDLLRNDVIPSWLN